MNKLMTAAAAAAMMIGLASAASAAVVVDYQPPFPPNPDENVLLGNDQVGLLVTGETNQTMATVNFLGQEDLTAPSNGQARITTPGVADDTDDGFNWIEISLVDAFFKEIEFNLDATAAGNVSFFFYDQFNALVTGTANPYAVGTSGQNFFTSYATGDTMFSKVRLTSTVDLSDMAQIRLGGVTGVVPEPATWAMMIGGFAAVGSMVRRRRALHTA